MEDTIRTEEAAFGQEDWNAAERFVWEAIRNRRVANFNAHLKTEALPSVAEHWSADRQIHAIFLAMLLEQPAYKSSPFGIRIKGAWIRECLDLRGLEIPNPMTLEHCRFDASIDLSDVHAAAEVSFDGSAIKASLTLDRAQIGGDLSLWETQVTGSLVATSIRLATDLVLTSCQCKDGAFSNSIIGGQVQANSCRFRKSLELQGVQIKADCFISEARLQVLDLQDAQIGGQLLISSTRCVQLVLQSTAIGSDFQCGDKSKFGKVNALGARIAGSASLNGAYVRGRLLMDNIRVGIELKMNRALFRKAIELNSAVIEQNLSVCFTTCRDDFQLKRARIGGVVNFGGTRVVKALDMQSSKCASHVFLRDGLDGALSKLPIPGTFAKVDLQDAKIIGTFYCRESTFSDSVNLDGLSVEYVWLRHSRFDGIVSIRSGEVSRNLDVSGSRFERQLDLSGVAIEGALDLGAADVCGPTWGRDAQLVLRDTSTAVVRDRRPENEGPVIDAWPANIIFGGFRYNRLGSHPDTAVADPPLSHRSIKWYLNWLKRDPDFANDSYQQLQSVLASQGEPGKANAVKFAARERLRKQTGGLRWFGLTMLKITIGYGIGYGFLLSIIWVLALSLTGAFIFEKNVPGQMSSFGAAWLFSLDQLLPIIKLYPLADDVAKRITGLPLAYLALHRILGFILSSFVVAGLSGLTQK